LFTICRVIALDDGDSFANPLSRSCFRLFSRCLEPKVEKTQTSYPIIVQAKPVCNPDNLMFEGIGLFRLSGVNFSVYSRAALLL